MGQTFRSNEKPIMGEDEWIQIAEFLTFLIVLAVLVWAQVITFWQGAAVFFADLIIELPLGIAVEMTRKERCPTCGSRHWNLKPPMPTQLRS